MKTLAAVFGYIAAFTIACAPGPAQDSESDAADQAPAYASAMLGRWDVSVSGDDPYPLWFEIVEHNETLSGRLQPRGGHALPFDSIDAQGDELTVTVSGTTYRGTLAGDAWTGTGIEGSNSLEWSATRAPELPAPSDPQWGEPIELFNGTDLMGWRPQDPNAVNHWQADNGALLNQESGANLMTEATFRDFKLHIEVNVPEGSNSGIYLRGRHEIQVQDDHGKDPHSQHMGGIYGQVTPTENPALPAGEWQTFDVTLLGRWVSVVLNGTTIIDHQEIPGITGGALDSDEGAPGPILLQGDHGRVLYRNFVLTPTVP